MDIEKLAGKLEPLMPREVQHWLRVRDTGDPDLKALIEKQIVSVAHQVLGDFRKEILLSRMVSLFSRTINEHVPE